MFERSNDIIADSLISCDAYHPFPTYDERALWSNPAFAWAIAEGVRYAGRSRPILPAVRYMDFARDGNRSRYEAIYFERRSALASLLIAECVEHNGRFIDDIIDLAWAVCEETSWVIPAHNGHDAKAPRALPDIEADIYIDLFSAATGSLLSWLWYFMHDILDTKSPLIARRIELEVKRRILDPYLTGRFQWTGLFGGFVNNWNPWINSNVLPAFLLLEHDSARRTAGIARTLQSVDRFIAGYHPDGGCDEGPGYWNAAGASLFDHLDMLRGAAKGIDAFSDPLIANIGRYIMRMHIADDYFVNFADSGTKLSVSSDLIHRYGKAVGDDGLAQFGASFFGSETQKRSDSWMFYRTLCALFNSPENATVRAKPPLLLHSWMDGIEVMTAREHEGSRDGLFVAAKGGHNAESHNHNDVGSFIVYADGKPVLIDVGVETYTRKTFSKERYEIWTMRSPYHNLPVVNGIEQSAGRSFAARDVHCTQDASRSSLSMDIASAYPPSAGIERWHRTVTLDRTERAVIMSDELSLASPGTIAFSLMTSRTVRIEGNDILLTAAGERTVCIRAEGLAYDIVIEPISLADDKLRESWGESVSRILLRIHGALKNGVFTMRISIV
ncbi:MAG: heparinase II/III family protein [Spirochaetota bacterium]